jgi:hypothetical protein
VRLFVAHHLLSRLDKFLPTPDFPHPQSFPASGSTPYGFPLLARFVQTCPDCRKASQFPPGGNIRNEIKITSIFNKLKAFFWKMRSESGTILFLQNQGN